MLKRYILKTYLNKLPHEYNFFLVLWAHVRWQKRITNFHIRSWRRSRKALIRASYDTWLSYHQLKAQDLKFPVSWKMTQAISQLRNYWLIIWDLDLKTWDRLQVCSLFYHHKVFKMQLNERFGNWRKISQHYLWNYLEVEDKLVSGLTLKNIFGLFWWCFFDMQLGSLYTDQGSVKELSIKGLDGWSPNLSVPKCFWSAFKCLSAPYIHEYHPSIKKKRSHSS